MILLNKYLHFDPPNINALNIYIYNINGGTKINEICEIGFRQTKDNFEL